MIADYFLHNPVLVDGEPRLLKMVSDEAFRLDASQAVNTIVNAMRYLANPDDGLTEAFLAKSFAGKELEPSDVARETGPDAKPSAPRHAYMPMLPPEFVASRAELLSMPLIDLAERLYGLFRLDRLKSGTRVSALSRSTAPRSTASGCSRSTRSRAWSLTT